MRCTFTLLAFAACGRVNFDPLGATDAIGGAEWPSFGAPQVSSVSTIYDDWTPELSRDGLHLFGAAYGAPGAVGQDDVWMVSRASLTDGFGAWTFAANLGTSGRDFGPAISPDGLTIFYGSGGGTGFTDPPAIFEATRSSLVANFGPTVVMTLSGGTVTRDPALSADGLTIYFDSDLGSPMGTTDIWYATRATLTSSWSMPIALMEVNTASEDRDPFISSDGLTLYFASDRAGSFGSQDLWVTIRPDLHSPFATPRNLMELNSGRSQGNPTISDDGLIMWDSSRSGGPGGTFGYDIWEARLQ